MMLCLAAAQPATAQQAGDDLPLEPLTPYQPIESLDIAGLWQFTMMQPSVSGHCPAGGPTQGQVRITMFGVSERGGPDLALDLSGDSGETGDETGGEEASPVEIDILSGVICNPAALCHLTGSYVGDMLSAGVHSVLVDEEGGRSSNAWSVQFTSDELGSGVSSSNYIHPSGFQCEWTTNFTLFRPEGDDN